MINNIGSKESTKPIVIPNTLAIFTILISNHTMTIKVYMRFNNNSPIASPHWQKDTMTSYNDRTNKNLHCLLSRPRDSISKTTELINQMNQFNSTSLIINISNNEERKIILSLFSIALELSPTIFLDLNNNLTTTDEDHMNHMYHFNIYLD